MMPPSSSTHKKQTKSTPKINRKRSRLSCSPTQPTPRTCFVKLSDIMNTSPNPTILPDPPLHVVKAEVSELRTKLDNLEKLINPLLPLIPLLSPAVALTPADLLKAAHLVDSLSSEISKRLKCERQILIHNVPDKFPSEKAKQAVLSTCGLNTAKCRTVRLKKSSPAQCCPLMLEFESPFEAQTIYSHRELLKSHPKLVNAKVCRAQTHLQREIVKTCLPKSIGSSSTAAENHCAELPVPSTSLGADPNTLYGTAGLPSIRDKDISSNSNAGASTSPRSTPLLTSHDESSSRTLNREPSNIDMDASADVSLASSPNPPASTVPITLRESIKPNTRHHLTNIKALNANKFRKHNKPSPRTTTPNLSVRGTYPFAKITLPLHQHQLTPPLLQPSILGSPPSLGYNLPGQSKKQSHQSPDSFRYRYHLDRPPSVSNPHTGNLLNAPETWMTPTNAMSLIFHLLPFLLSRCDHPM